MSKRGTSEQHTIVEISSAGIHGDKSANFSSRMSVGNILSLCFGICEENQLGDHIAKVPCTCAIELTKRLSIDLRILDSIIRQQANLHVHK